MGMMTLTRASPFQKISSMWRLHCPDGCIFYHINTNKKGVHINSCISFPKNTSVDCTLFKTAASSITLTLNINTNKKGVHIDSCITLSKNTSVDIVHYPDSYIFYHVNTKYQHQPKRSLY